MNWHTYRIIKYTKTSTLMPPKKFGFGSDIFPYERAFINLGNSANNELPSVHITYFKSYGRENAPVFIWKTFAFSLTNSII